MSARLAALVALLTLAGCDRRHHGLDDTALDDTGAPGGDGPLEWIGSPCDSDSDCPYEGGTCLRDAEGYPRGMCSVACDQLCPDADGHPVTFCVDDADLPADAPALGDGACHSRCDFGFFPATGCRPGYGCVVSTRANEPGTHKFTCMPGESTDLSDCYFELAAAGVRFEPTVLPEAHPDGHPELTCHVEDPVVVRPPVHGVEVPYVSGETVGLTASCEMAHALSDTLLDVGDHGAIAAYHMGTYNCRVIAGTDTLSQHSHGNAIDFSGFTVDGTTWSLTDDWEHDTIAPATPGGAWLYDAAYRWFDAGYWNIILTPNYNVAHDDHFHVDLTPGGDYIGFTDSRYIGPAPYAD